MRVLSATVRVADMFCKHCDVTPGSGCSIFPSCIVKPFPTLRLAEGVYRQPPLHDAWIEPIRVAAPAS